MKKKTKIVIAFIVLFLLVGGVGLACWLFSSTEDTGHVELSRIYFPGTEGSNYDITRLMVRAERDGRGTTEEVMSLPHDLGELREGKWKIYVDAYDSRGNFISTCSADVDVSQNDIQDLALAFELPDPEVDVPNGRFLRVEPEAEFTLNANYRPLRVGTPYTYIWTFWPTDTDSPSTHVVDMHTESTLSSDAFWEIWQWYGGKANEFQYSVDVSGNGQDASFSGIISVVHGR